MRRLRATGRGAAVLHIRDAAAMQLSCYCVCLFLASDSVGDDVIRTAANHPFFVKGKGCVAAVMLAPGDLLRTIQREWVEVKKVEDSRITEPVFNLQVEAARTYLVHLEMRCSAVLVHNQSAAPKADGGRPEWAS